MNSIIRRIQMTDGSEIYFEKRGQGFPLFLLHGNGGNGRFFSKQIATFEKYYTVYIVDSRGHGYSTNHSPELSFRLLAEDLQTIMEVESINKANLLGFSDGANLAMTFAVLYPEKVNRLILNSGNLFFKGVRLLGRLESKIEYFLVFLGCFFSKKCSRFLPIVDLLLHDIGITEQDLATLTCPTLILVGRCDVIKLSHSLFLARTIQKSSFILINGQGHQFARKNPERFNQEVLNFLNEVY
ncbi:MAG: alpha/beta fold hydrolase [Enterococcus sp.]